MNKKSTFKLIFSVLLLSIISFIFFIKKLDKETKESKVLSEKYGNYLENHPFRKTMKLSKEERLSKGLPPNKYFEQEWLYTSDPVLLRPAPEKVHQLQKELANNFGMKSAPGDPSNSWVERGPNNIGGRTRALLFAPGSTIKVFSGSVSGGLWVNDDITNPATVWQRVNGVPGNLSVSSITVDPNDSNIMYLGTGEVYTWGAVNGNGIYKSTDGGNNWFNIYEGGAGIANKITYVQDIVAWNNPVTNQTEIYFGADAMAYTEEVESGSAGAGWNWLGSNTIGLYKSTDGTNFNRLTGALYESSAGKYFAPNTFDIGADGKLWMGTKYSYYTGEGGGRVFSNDGNNWTNVRNIGTNGRVEIACSKQNANKIYVLVEDRVNTANPAKIFRTTNGFSSAPSLMALPNDADTGIAAGDFTRGQSFYDLMIGVDPNDDTTLYVGGIDIFKSTNSGGSWNQLSHWYGGFGYQNVHADQHGIAFSSSNRIIFGNDGGVYYTNNGGTNAFERNNGYNVTQFYKAAINQQTSTDKLLAGAQDNGSQFINNAPPGISSSTETYGGDGCWVFIDQQNEYMIASYVYNTYIYARYNDGLATASISNNQTDGDFVNQCGLDSDANKLYANGSNGTSYRIYRYSINPSNGATTRATLTNAMLNTVPTYFTASPFVNNRILVGTALGKIIRLNNANGTPSWTDISMPGQVGAVSDIRYGQSENDIMVTFHNYGVNSIWYTNDGGSNWVSKEGNLPDMPVKCILQNPLSPEEVIVGTELGVWKTSDWGNANPTWVQSQNGMSDVKVLSFDFRDADNTIVAATFGRGMFTGTFEVEACASTTTYNAGWNNGIPSNLRSAIIYSDYDSSIDGSIDACTFRVTEGKTVTIKAGDYLKVSGDIIIDRNATLTIEHEGSLVQVDDNATVTNNGTINVIKTTPVATGDSFSILGSPMSGTTRGGAYVDNNVVMYHQTAQFNLDPDVTAVNAGAEHFADVEGDNWQFISNGTTNVFASEGYLLGPTTQGVIDGFYDLTYNEGTLNNGIYSFNTIYNPGATPAERKSNSPNILSNPYASAIDADALITNNAVIDEIYFWEHLTTPSAGYPGYRFENWNMGDISIRNMGGSVQAPNGGTVPIQFIASGQGFAIKANAAGTVTFNNALRVTGNNTGYRNSTSETERMYLNIENATYHLKSSALIAFTSEATDEYEAQYDAKRLATPISIYSVLDERELAIQGRSVFTMDQVIPLGFRTMVEEEQTYTISLGNIEGDNITQATIYLQDNLLGKVINLSETDYIFTSNESNQKDRFVIVFGEEQLGNNDATLESISVYPNPTVTMLNIVSLLSSITNVAIYDVGGRLMKSTKVNNQTNYQFDISSLEPALYFVYIDTGNGSIIKRVIKSNN